MTETTRFGVSIGGDLLEKFDLLIEDQGYLNRSEAIRDLIRNRLAEEQIAEPDSPAMGSLTLVYDHHTRDLSDKLTEHQHSHHQKLQAE